MVSIPISTSIFTPDSTLQYSVYLNTIAILLSLVLSSFLIIINTFYEYLPIYIDIGTLLYPTEIMSIPNCNTVCECTEK